MSNRARNSPPGPFPGWQVGTAGAAAGIVEFDQNQVPEELRGGNFFRRGSCADFDFITDGQGVG